MKHGTAYTKNVDQANSTLLTLMNRSYSLPGFGLFDGRPGDGKTWATLSLFNSIDNGVYIRATRLDTPSTFLEQMLKELGCRDMPRSKRARLARVVELLSMDPKVIFIDEADYYMDQPEILETIRDIHDLSDCVVLLVGMDKISNKLASIPQLDSRIRHRYQFQPADLEDLKIMVEELFEDGITVGDKLLMAVLSETKGNFRLSSIALENIENKAKVDKLRHIDIEHWKDEFEQIMPVL